MSLKIYIWMKQMSFRDIYLNEANVIQDINLDKAIVTQDINLNKANVIQGYISE